MWKKGFILSFIFMLGVYQLNAINALMVVAETVQIEHEENADLNECDVLEDETIEESETSVEVAESENIIEENTEILEVSTNYAEDNINKPQPDNNDVIAGLNLKEKIELDLADPNNGNFTYPQAFVEQHYLKAIKGSATFDRYEFETIPNLNQIGMQEVKVKMIYTYTYLGKSEQHEVLGLYIDETKTQDYSLLNITPKDEHLLLAERSSGASLMSVSLTKNQGMPILQANDGFDLNGQNFSNGINFRLWQNNVEQTIHDSINNPEPIFPSQIRDSLNEKFASMNFNYGDVVAFETYKYTQPASWSNENGSNTYVIKNQNKTLETNTYPTAYYELTSSGYQLVQLTKFSANNNMVVAHGTSIEELEQRAKDFIEIPTGVDASNYTFELIDCDDITTIGSNKKATVRVTEPLKTTGKTFSKDYEAKFTVKENLWGTAPTQFNEETCELTVGAGILSNSQYPNMIPIHKVKIITFTDPENTVLPADASYLFSSHSGILPKPVFAQLQSIENINSLNTDDVIDMSYMFYDTLLTNLDLNSWNTENVTNMDSMFWSSNNLTNLNLNSWNTENVTNMKFMFQNVNTLKDLDLSNWNTENVTNMQSMFSNANSLTNLILGDGWDTSNAMNMSYMFHGASSLTNLDLHDWDTSNVTNMSHMFEFEGANSLTNLDLHGWDTSNVTNMNQMFNGANKLSTLTLGEDFQFTSSVALPAINTSSGEYTGAWERIDPRLPESIYESSNDFMSDYNGTEPGTYIWQDHCTIIVTDSIIDQGEQWNPEHNFVSATDSFGESISFADISISGAEDVDVNQPGEYELIYSYGRKASIATITVNETSRPEINITIPTNMLFGTFEKDKQNINSEDYAIINNSDNANTKIDIATFKRTAGSPDILKLLEEEEPDPSSETNAARLHLFVNDALEPTISSLNEATENEELMVLPPNQKATLKFGGTYFGNLENKHQLDHQMKLKFSVIP